MIRYIQNGDLFASRADSLINPVNCVGIMNTGLAKEFRERYPECLDPYREACVTVFLDQEFLFFAPGKMAHR